jgi:hypothetical protein
MKVAAVFIVILAIMLVTLPMVMQGDGTLAGKIRTLLAYGTGLTAVLLSLVTVLLSVAVVTSDVEAKRIFMVATKPLARWQYILGRFLGVVLLDVLLLAVAGASIYGAAQYLRRQTPLNPDDRRRVETEVFASRGRVTPQPVDVEAKVQDRTRRLQEEGRYQQALEAYRAKTGGDADRAKKMLDDQIREEETAAAQSVGVGGIFNWSFKGIKTIGQPVSTTGKILDAEPKYLLYRIQAPATILGRLVYGGPVQINGVVASTAQVGQDYFEAQFFKRDIANAAVLSLSKGSEVRIDIDPTIQLTYRASTASDPPDKTLQSLWQFQNSKTGFLYQVPRGDAIRTNSTLTVSARVVDDEGRTEVQYLNLPWDVSGLGSSVTILNSDVSILFPVDRFEWNFLRGLLLVLMQLIFLAAVGVFAGSFLSFPVACLVSFTVLPVALARTFLVGAMTVVPSASRPEQILQVIGGHLVSVLNALLPDLAKTMPSELLADGLNIPWSLLATAAILTVVLRAGLALLLACWIFSRRELARVQV